MENDSYLNDRSFAEFATGFLYVAYPGLYELMIERYERFKEESKEWTPEMKAPPKTRPNVITVTGAATPAKQQTLFKGKI